MTTARAESGGPLIGPAAPPFGAYTAPSYRARLDSIDILRGIVMVIMLLDHTRDFFHGDALRFDPTDPTRTSVVLFFTRWITHFCAPVFVFLAGTGAYLRGTRGATVTGLSRFLITRGLWLILLEFTLVRFGLSFNLDYRFLGVMQVIWAIGVSMIVLAGLVRLPVRSIAVFGIGMILLHNLLDGVRIEGWSGPGTTVPSLLDGLWMVLHQPGPLPIFGFPGPVVFVMYPLFPWIGVMAAGYAFGAVYRWRPERRQRFLIRAGIAGMAAFMVIRGINLYGDPQPWAFQKSTVFTALSFLNVTKYPPSLLFLLMTLGPSMLALAWLERRSGRGFVTNALTTFGRVPLFYYLLQWPVSHGLAVIVGFTVGQPVSYQFLNPFEKPFPAPPEIGFDLWVVYVFWIVGLIILYPLCNWFAGVKARRRDWWVGYL